MRFRQRSDDFLGDAVREELLLRVPAQVLKCKLRNRGLVGQRKAAGRCLTGRCRRVGSQLIDPHRPRNVFELLLAGILKVDVELAADLPISVVGDTDTARLGDAFQPWSDVNAIAKACAGYRAGRLQVSWFMVW
jgi:hypothetical protein